MALKGREATKAERRALNHLRMMDARYNAWLNEVCDVEAHKERRVAAGKPTWMPCKECVECHVELINATGKLIFYALYGEEMDEQERPRKREAVPKRPRGTV